MKKAKFGILGLVSLFAFAVSALDQTVVIPDDSQLQEWAQMAEDGDTAALHYLICFYDENSYVVVVENETDTIAWGPEYEPWPDKATNELYAKRLDYWLDKGLLLNDSVAIEVKGIRLYHSHGAAAMPYLFRAANMGSARAALFYGSECWNQSRGSEAFKYLSKAYELGEPGAGWHLAMCYSAGVGTRVNREKAIEVMRHDAMRGFTEALFEMHRIEPDNKIWRQKADSLNIDIDSEFGGIQVIHD